MTDEMVEVLEFTCPLCGSHSFGSGMPWNLRSIGRPFTEAEFQQHMEGQCHGRYETPRESRACDFRWNRGRDDAKYFRGTGRFMKRTVKGEMPS
jgi:hypothetical protein